MRQLVDRFDSTTGWSATDASITFSTTQWPDYIAEDFSAALLVHIPAGSLGKIIQKTVTFPAYSGPAVNLAYQEMVISAWSRNRARSDYRSQDDLQYLVRANGGAWFYGFPIYPGFQQSNLPSYVFTTGDKAFEIKINHDEEDWIVLSGLNVVVLEHPRDIMEGMKAELERWRGMMIYDPYICDFRGELGDSVIEPSARTWLDRYAVVAFWNDNDADESTVEFHQLDIDKDGQFTFMSTYAGKLLTRTYDDTTGGYLYLYFPVVYGQMEKEAVIPGIVLWSMAPEPLLRGSLLDTDWHSITDNSAMQGSRSGQVLNFTVQIEVAARQYEMVSALSKVVRAFLSRGYLWINGVRHNFVWRETARETEPTMPVETLPRVLYTVDVEVVEPVYVYDAFKVAATPTVTVTPVSEVP